MPNALYTPTKADREKVESYAAIGTPHEHIAKLIINPRTKRPIGIKTLRRKFGPQLELARSKRNEIVASKIWDIVQKIENVSEAVYTKMLLSWMERYGIALKAMEHPGAREQQATEPDGLDLSTLTDQELDTLRALFAAAAERRSGRARSDGPPRGAGSGTSASEPETIH